MIRWRYCLVLAVLLLLPTRIGSKVEDDDEDDRDDDGEDEDDNDDDVEEEQVTDKTDHAAGRRAPPLVLPTSKPISITRTVQKRLLECYVCAYKSETPLRACLDPTKYRVHTITCHSADDKCFTSVMSKGNTYEAVVRGCRSGCVGTPDTMCCEVNRCNNQALSMPVIAPRSLDNPAAVSAIGSKANKTLQPTIFFFVTILLVLQTVVKVTLV